MSTTTFKRKATDPGEAPLKALRQILHDVDNRACENGLNDLSQAMREACGLAQSGKDTGQALLWSCRFPPATRPSPCSR
jgi:hypothetical protein